MFVVVVVVAVDVVLVSFSFWFAFGRFWLFTVFLETRRINKTRWTYQGVCLSIYWAVVWLEVGWWVRFGR